MREEKLEKGRLFVGVAERSTQGRQYDASGRRFESERDTFAAQERMYVITKIFILR